MILVSPSTNCNVEYFQMKWLLTRSKKVRLHFQIFLYIQMTTLIWITPLMALIKLGSFLKLTMVRLFKQGYSTDSSSVDVFAVSVLTLVVLSRTLCSLIFANFCEIDIVEQVTYFKFMFIYATSWYEMHWSHTLPEVISCISSFQDVEL